MRVHCFGLMVCDILARPVTGDLLSRDTTRVEEILINTGGDALNVAIDLGMLGTPVTLVGRIGDDEFGRVLVKRAAEANVDISRVVYSNETKTATVIVLVSPGGKRSFVYAPGANDELVVDDFDTAQLQPGDALVLSGALALPRMEGSSIARLFESAKRRNVMTFLDVTSDQLNLGGGLSPAFPFTDVFLPNFDEASDLTGEQDPEKIARTLASQGVGTVVVKLGSQGAYILSRGESCHVPAVAVDAVDTTGAGDAFVAGFVSAHMRGIDLLPSVRYGVAMGSLCVKHLGAPVRVAGFDELERLLQTAGMS